MHHSWAGPRKSRHGYAKYLYILTVVLTPLPHNLHYTLFRQLTSKCLRCTGIHSHTCWAEHAHDCRRHSPYLMAIFLSARVWTSEPPTHLPHQASHMNHRSTHRPHQPGCGHDGCIMKLLLCMTWAAAGIVPIPVLTSDGRRYRTCPGTGTILCRLDLAESMYVSAHIHVLHACKALSITRRAPRRISTCT
jgi:hypothetical protein